MSFKDIAFFNFRDGLGVNVIRWRGLKVGPVLKPALNREESGFNPFRIAGRKTEALRGLGDVDFGLEFIVLFHRCILRCGVLECWNHDRMGLLLLK